jgi:hypothetical protein
LHLILSVLNRAQHAVAVRQQLIPNGPVSRAESSPSGITAPVVCCTTGPGHRDSEIGFVSRNASDIPLRYAFLAWKLPF